MKVSKYSASGNDFVIFHTDHKVDRSALAKEICHRQDGIGADGLIVIIPCQDTTQKADFEWQFYNSDGSSAEMCGNGSRACAHYAFTHNLADTKMSFVTEAGIINAQVDGTIVQSELTPPKILDKNIIYKDKSWWHLDTGVPHMVHVTDNIESFDILEARELRYKYNANVNIVSVNENSLHVRTYERGVEDETLACGTGMAACYYRTLLEGLIEGSVEVYPRSGVTLYLGMNDRTITFKGEVKNTFVTEWEVS